MSKRFETLFEKADRMGKNRDTLIYEKGRSDFRAEVEKVLREEIGDADNNYEVLQIHRICRKLNPNLTEKPCPPAGREKGKKGGE